MQKKISLFNFWVKFCVPEPRFPCCHCIIVPVMSLCSQRWKTRRALMMHYHRSQNEPHKSPWHLPPHNTSKWTAAFLKDVAFPQSKAAQRGNVPVGFCQDNHLFLSLLLGQLRPCLLFFSLPCFCNED